MATANGPLQKLAGLQSIIPQFDNTSVVTPQFFINNFETVAALIDCSDQEKLLILKSRIRGEALAQLIITPDLQEESNYENFKTKFLAFFDKKVSMATRQQQFSNCCMQPGESVKVYAARVSRVTQKFFNNPDLSNASVKALFEQSKLSKFLEGLLDEYKHPTLMKDPQSFQSALDFVELLETNRSCFSQSNQNSQSSPAQIPVNATSEQISNQEIKSLLETHAQQTHASICTLTKEVEKLKFNRNNIQRNASNLSTNYQKNPNNRSIFEKNRPFPECQYCGRNNHISSFCYYKRANFQRSFNRQHSTYGHNKTNRVNQECRSDPRYVRFTEPSRPRHLNERRGSGGG